ncbi:hypothetical protein HYV86_02970 [Candidatus Woesearchaeota archaeon]|nr:hypothetical protein [Candidatus Woesearchaeota archaeon]
MNILKIRESINQQTASLARSLTPESYKKAFHTDLGDLLTLNVDTPRRLATTVGAITPVIISYFLLPIIDKQYSLDQNPDISTQIDRLAQAITGTYFNPLAIPPVIGFIGIGYAFGVACEQYRKSVKHSNLK